MNGKEFFEQMPYMAKGTITDLNKRRLSELFGVMYQYEMDNDLSAFARTSEDVADPYNRTRIVFDLLRCMGGDNERVTYMEECVVNKSLESYSIKKNETVKKAKSTFLNFPDIDKALSSETKETVASWWTL